MAAQRVEDHLGTSAEGYDETIRRFVPHYAEALRTVAEIVAGVLADFPPVGKAGLSVADLGAGTGALTDALAARLPGVNFLAVDGDARMLAAARARLGRWKERVEFREAAFESIELPRNCSAVVASLALHHVRCLREKAALYRRIFNALAPGGIFVNADAVLAATGPARDAALKDWIAHQTVGGISEVEARRNLETWQRTEDRYFSVEEELRALAEAGFDSLRCDVVWRRGPLAVILAAR